MINVGICPVHGCIWDMNLQCIWDMNLQYQLGFTELLNHQAVPLLPAVLLVSIFTQRQSVDTLGILAVVSSIFSHMALSHFFYRVMVVYCYILYIYISTCCVPLKKFTAKKQTTPNRSSWGCCRWGPEPGWDGFGHRLRFRGAKVAGGRFVETALPMVGGWMSRTLEVSKDQRWF